jgi:MFS family permease
MAGEAVSMTGTWMQVMAQSWVMANLTDKAVVLGLTNFASGLPMLALTMLGGTFADRYDKRRILVVTQVVQILFALIIGYLVATGRIQVWHIIVTAALLGISAAFEMPSAAALVPELVSRSQVAQAIAIDRSIFHGTRLIGPALAGYVVGVWGAGPAFFLNAISFLALIVALLSIRPGPSGSVEEEAQRRGGVGQGIAYVRSDKPTLAMIGLMASTTLFVFPAMMVMLPLYVKNVLGLGPNRMGVLMGIAATGSLTGAIGLLAVRRDRRLSLMFLATLGITLALTGLSLTRNFAPAAACLVLLSLSVSGIIGLANTVVQERAPSAMRGRVSAIAGLSFFGLMPFAGLGITSVSDWLGMQNALRIAAMGYVITAGLALVQASRKSRDQSGDCLTWDRGT